MHAWVSECVRVYHTYVASIVGTSVIIFSYFPLWLWLERLRDRVLAIGFDQGACWTS